MERLIKYAEEQLNSRREKRSDHPLFAAVVFLKVIQENIKILPAAPIESKVTSITQPITESIANLLTSSLSGRDGILKKMPSMTIPKSSQEKESGLVNILESTDLEAPSVNPFN